MPDTTGPITSKILRDVLHSDAMRPKLTDDAHTNAHRWRFLQHALQVLEEAGWLTDPAARGRATGAPIDAPGAAPGSYDNEEEFHEQAQGIRPADPEKPLVPTCQRCHRERTIQDAYDYHPAQAALFLPLGWYSGDDGEICGPCLAALMGRTLVALPDTAAAALAAAPAAIENEIRAHLLPNPIQARSLPYGGQFLGATMPELARAALVAALHAVDLPRAADPDAFEDHPIEERRHAAHLQWAARRRVAADHAYRIRTALLGGPTELPSPLHTDNGTDRA